MAQAIETPRAGAQGTGHDDIGQEHAGHPPTSLGMDHRKLFMWLFLASDCMFFGALIATYMIYRSRSEELGTGPFPNELIDIPYTSVSTFVLLMSSLTMVLALNALQHGKVRQNRLWLLGTALLGMVFLGGQYFEFTEFYHEGLSLQTNLFGATFFTLTGFHGTHVAIGIMWILGLLFVSLRGGLRQNQSMALEVMGLYWHFVDIVWIVIFTLVYLIPYPDATSETGAEQALNLVGMSARTIGSVFG